MGGASQRKGHHAAIQIPDDGGAGQFISEQNIPGDSLCDSLQSLAGLIANLTESYTSAIFIKDLSRDVVRPVAVHTLSRDFIHSTAIAFGAGLVGWTAENKLRISVCPFEHDASTLLFYSCDQALKSFIAVPIVDHHANLLGVISCDSKKSYAFAKVTEKILMDCAKQAAVLITLHRKIARTEKKPSAGLDRLGLLLERLRDYHDEKRLLQAAAAVPQETVARDALVIVTVDGALGGKAAFYSSSNEDRVGHRLLDLVCSRKKIICAERSVHALPTDDVKQRSFLSIPFQVLGKEAGSFNLLSRPSEAFDAEEIAAVEQIARVVGREVERLRLLNAVTAVTDVCAPSSFKDFHPSFKAFHPPFQAFHDAANAMIEDCLRRKTEISLIRFHLANLAEIESTLGAADAGTAVQTTLRLIDQVKRPPAQSCFLYGSDILLLCESSDVRNTLARFSANLERVGLSPDIPSSHKESGRDRRLSTSGLGQLLVEGMTVAVAHAPRDGHTLDGLLSKTLRLLKLSINGQLPGNELSAKRKSANDFPADFPAGASAGAAPNISNRA